MQIKLNINKENFKALSKREIKGEKNGKAKEYLINSDILIFEGEYKNWKRNGKGIEYYTNGTIKFKGEYLKGKIMEGEGYDKEGNLILKIEKNGFGKQYCDIIFLSFSVSFTIYIFSIKNNFISSTIIFFSISISFSI